MEIHPAICQISKQVIFSIILEHVKLQHLLDKRYPLGPVFSKEQEDRKELSLLHLCFLLMNLALQKGTCSLVHRAGGAR